MKSKILNGSIVLGFLFALLMPSLQMVASASITNTRADAWGTLELAGSGWLSSGGVDVYSNGSTWQGPSPDTWNCVTVSGGTGGQGCGTGTVPSGIEWQCVELVNRLYLTKGWTTSRWTGNGGQMYDNAPSSLTKQLNGNVSNLNPGDVVVMQKANDPGHVAIVNSVTPATSGFTVQLVNQNTTAVYTSITLSADGKTLGNWSSYTTYGVVHAPGATSGGSSSAYSDGTFLKINESQAIYRVVGGAPIRIYNQGALPDFNGQVTNISNAQLGSMPNYPNDEGDIINLPEAGNAKYRFVGGAPVRIFDCGAIPGNCTGAISVNFQSLVNMDHMRSTPKDGAVISIAEAGGSGIYEFVGGAPIRQYNWGAIPNFGPAIVVNSQSLANLDHMKARPADGAVVSIVEAGGAGIYRFVGGAPVRLYNWGAIPDMPNVVGINSQSLSELDHMNARPADGSVINIAEAGGSGIYRFAGGAPMRLYNWGPIPNMPSAVIVNYQSLTELDHMNALPVNGTFVKSLETGVVYRIAGGAALRLYNPASISGSSSAIIVNQQTIDTNDHLLATPADGTIIMGLTSQTYWQITNGQRTQVSSQNGAVVVDDQTVADIPQAQS